VNCSSCGISVASFGLTFFDSKCSACVSFDELRDHEIALKNEHYLNDFFDRASSKSGTYDCLVPVRPDAEDYFVVNYLVSRGINPLVVLVNNFFLNDIGWHNFHNLITFYDVDSVAYSPNYPAYQEMVRASLRKLGSIYYPYKAIQHGYVMRLAREKSIPVVVWGQCQPLEFSGKFSRRDRLFLSQWWVHEHETNGVTPEQFLGTGVQLNKRDHSMLQYPRISETRGVKSVFLSNFLPWDQVGQNMDALSKGFVTESLDNSYDGFENSGSSVYYQMHDLLRVKSVGIPKLYEHVARDTRFGRWSLDVGSKMLANLQPYLSYNIDSFFKDFLGVTSSGLNWFVKNQLDGVSHLIRAHPEKNIREEVESLYTGPRLSGDVDAKHQFVKFMKGI